jgi:hypothetical protein
MNTFQHIFSEYPIYILLLVGLTFIGVSASIFLKRDLDMETELSQLEKHKERAISKKS